MYPGKIRTGKPINFRIYKVVKNTLDSVVAGPGFFGIPAWVAVTGALRRIVVSTLFRRYWRWERIALTFALGNLVFIPVAFLVHPAWGQVAHAMITWRPLIQQRPQRCIKPAMANIFYRKPLVRDGSLLEKQHPGVIVAPISAKKMTMVFSVMPPGTPQRQTGPWRYRIADRRTQNSVELPTQRAVTRTKPDWEFRHDLPFAESLRYQW
ncbi:hypothetical protein [Sulfobacillus harzensis]|uniref:hypothetical protein n=1 Tax=Sulfobacillus harzensis TaxID=2729629 RepID=UPI00145C6A8C|nr:hypothetical protein [Sulfobacillus harzensis]